MLSQKWRVSLAPRERGAGVTFMSFLTWIILGLIAGFIASHLVQHRVKARRGWAKAIVATSHKPLVIAFQVLKANTAYKELGRDYFDRLNPARTARKLVQRLEAL